MATFFELRAFQIVLMKYLGLLPFADRKYLQHALFIISSGSIISFMFMIIEEHLKLKDFDKQIMSGFAIGAVTYASVRFLMIRGEVARIQGLYQDLDGIAFNQSNMQEVVAYDKTMKRAQFFIRMVSALYCSMIVATFVQPLVFRCFMVPTDNWYPLENSRSFLAWCSLFSYEAICMFYISSTSVLVDTFAFLPLIVINGLFENLGLEMANLPTHPVGSWTATLRVCLLKYMKVNRACRNFESIFSKVYLFHMAILSIILCSSAIAVNLMPSEAYFLVATTLCTIIFEIYSPCFLGNAVLETSEKLKFHLYSSNWQNIYASESKTGLFIFMEVLKRPIFLSFGHIFMLNLETFSQIVNLVYRLYALARYFIEREQQRN